MRGGYIRAKRLVAFGSGWWILRGSGTDPLWEKAVKLLGLKNSDRVFAAQGRQRRVHVATREISLLLW